MSLSRGDDAGGSASIVRLLVVSGDIGGAREELEDVIVRDLKPFRAAVCFCHGSLEM